MSAGALILTYHAVEEGDGPLYFAPKLLAEHLDAIAASGAEVVTISELAAALRDKAAIRPTVAITFDDGAASVARVAAPLLAERSLGATVFCVAGRLGGRSDWPSARPGPTFELATAAELAELVASGWEIGAHGMTHAPLVGSEHSELERQIVRSKHVLEQTIGGPVRSFAYPYGAGPTRAARELVRTTYDAACSTRLGYLDAQPDASVLPRIDAHYVRDPNRLQSALDGTLKTYLMARGTIARVRRLVRADYDRKAVSARPDRGSPDEP